MRTDTTITKAHDAALDLLNRTQASTRHAVDTMQERRDRVRGELKARTEPTAEQISDAVNELIAWARRNSERLVSDLDELRTGLEARLAPVTVVTKADLAQLEARLAETEAKLDKALKAAAKPKAKSTKKAPAKKAVDAKA